MTLDWNIFVHVFLQEVDLFRGGVRIRPDLRLAMAHKPEATVGRTGFAASRLLFK